jgi:hypothetical protein
MLLWVCLIPSPVLADARANVIVTAIGFVTVPLHPTNLLITEYGTNCFNMTWEKGLNSPTTTLVMCRESERDCADRDFGNYSDGCWLLYQGNGTALDSNSCGIELDIFEYTITGWGSDGAVFSTNCEHITFGGKEMTDILLLMIFVGMGVIFLLVGVLKKISWITMASAIPWALTAFFAYGKYDDTGDFLWEVLTLFGVVMFFVAGAMSIGRDRGDAGAGYDFPKTKSQETRARWKARVGD